MRIGVTSDIHIDISPANAQIVTHIADEIKKADIDVFLICGDLSPNLMTLSRTLSAFHDVNAKCRKLFVAGNHDIWLPNVNGEINSHHKYSIITDICKENGFHHLGDSPYIIEEVGFCGTIGWYDYSYKNKKFPIAERSYQRKTLAGSVWNDVNFAHWNATDSEVAKGFENDLQKQIEGIREHVMRIIVATHHVPFQDCVTYRNELPWDFFSAFMGSAGLGEICIKEPMVTHALFGHTHTEICKKVGQIWAICSPIGYLTNPPKDLGEYARNRIKIIELDNTRC